MRYSSKRTGCGFMLLLFSFIMIGMTGCGKQERKEISVYIADDGTCAVSGPEAEAEAKINEYLQTETQQILTVYKENMGAESFFQTQMLQYEVSGSYLSIYCELWTESMVRADDYDVARVSFVFSLEDGHRVFPDEIMDVDAWMELLRQTENVVCIKDEIDPLYTATVRERLAERSDEELCAELAACCMSETEWLKCEESLWDKASFGLYDGKYCFYFTLMEGFYW